MRKEFILHGADYNDEAIQSLVGLWAYRLEVQPINLIFLLCFIGATLHAFSTPWLKRVAKRWGAQDVEGFSSHPEKSKRGLRRLRFFPQMLAFTSEIEIIFGLWCLPALGAMVWVYGFDLVSGFLAREDYREAFFIALSFIVATTAPVMRVAEKGFCLVAKAFGGSPQAWWWVIQLFGVLLGAVMKESIAMTLCATFLGSYFFIARPPSRLAYASLGLLLTNISLAGLITHFGSTTLKILDRVWSWDTRYILTMFGWKAILSIFVSTFAVYVFCRNDFFQLSGRPPVTERKSSLPPWWVMGVHLLILGGVIASSENPIIAYGLIVFLLGFYEATLIYQTQLLFKEALMIGFFIASIMVLGSLQDWWISPVFDRLDGVSVAFFTFLLSSINQNQALAFIATHITSLHTEDAYYFTVGMAAAGGLTLISNVPNMIAYKLLSPSFGGVISMRKHFIYALLPAFISFLIFILL